MTEAQRPKWQNSISLGNLLTLLALIFGAGGMWYTSQHRIQIAETDRAAIRRETDKRFEETDAHLEKLYDVLSALEARQRQSEGAIARSEERYSSILTYLARIDSRLDRIENRAAPR